MLTHPELVRDIHQEYIVAGAEIIITNTFSTGRDMLEEGGLDHKIAEANKLGIEAAVQARRNAGAEDSVVIAASVSTMAPKAHAEVPVPYEKALETYREQLGELTKGGPDVVVGEMLVRISDTLAVIEAAAELGLPVWVGLSLVRDGDGLYLGIQDRHGNETLQDAMDAHQGQGHRIGIHNAHAGGRHGSRAGDSQEELVGNLRRLRPFPPPRRPNPEGKYHGPTAVPGIRQGVE